MRRRALLRVLAAWWRGQWPDPDAAQAALIARAQWGAGWTDMRGGEHVRIDQPERGRGAAR